MGKSKTIRNTGHLGSERSNIIKEYFDSAAGNIAKMFSSSFNQALFGNNKLTITIVVVFKELQLLPLCFLPQHFWAESGIFEVLSSILAVVNPALYALTLPETNITWIKIVLVLFTLFTLVAVALADGGQSSTRSRIQGRDKNWLKLIGIFLLAEMLPIPSFTLFISSITCLSGYKLTQDGLKELSNQSSFIGLTEGCSSTGTLNFSVTGLLNWIFFIHIVLYIWAVYLMKRMNFNDKMKNSGYGLKIKNNGDAHSFLVKCLTIMLVFSTRRNRVYSAVSLAAGSTASFVLKFISGEFICPDYEKLHKSVVAIPLWLSLLIACFEVSNGTVKNMTYLIIASFSFLVGSILIKKPQVDFKLTQKTIAELRGPHECAKRLSTLLWLYKRSRLDRESRYHLLYEGYCEAFIHTPKKEEVGLGGKMSMNTLSTDFERSKKQLDYEETTRLVTVEIESKRKSEKQRWRPTSKSIFVNFIMKEYIQSIKKYPDSVFLRLSFIQFILDFTDLHNIARFQISALDEVILTPEILIKKFRVYKTINEIDEETSKYSSSDKISGSGAGAGQRDPTGSPANIANFFSETLILKLNSLMTAHLETATTNYMYFWQTLLDDSPKIDKVRDWLFLSYEMIHEAELFYNKNQVFSKMNLEGKKNYALYIREILKQEREGEKLLQSFFLRMKRVVRNKNKLVGISLDSDLGEYQSPMFLVTGDEGSHMTIKNCNREFCQKVGYPKENIAGSALRKIIPSNALNFYKNKFLERQHEYTSQTQHSIYIDHPKNNTSSKNYSLISIKHSSGCLLFYSARIDCMIDDKGSRFLVVKIHMEVVGQAKAQILVNSRGIIKGNSAHCMPVFKLDQVVLRSIGFRNIDELLPGLNWGQKLQEGGSSQGGRGGRAGRLERSNPVEFSSKIGADKYTQKIGFCFTANQMSDSKLFLVKIWRPQRLKPQEINSEILELSRISLSARESNFGFYVSEKLQIVGTTGFGPFEATQTGKLITGELTGTLHPPEKEIIKSKIAAPLNAICMQASAVQYLRKLVNKKIGRSDSREVIDYSEGIITRRLVDGHLRDIYDDDEFNLDSEGLSNRSPTKGGKSARKAIFNKRGDRRDYRSRNSYTYSETPLFKIDSVKNQSTLESIVLSRKKQYRSISAFKVLSLLISLSFVGVVSLMFLQGFFDLEEMEHVLHLDREATWRSGVLQILFNDLTHLALMNQGYKLTKYAVPKLPELQYKKMYFEDFSNTLQELRRCHNEINSRIPKLDSVEQIRKIQAKEHIMILSGSSSKNYTFEQAINQVISMSLTIVNKDPEKIVFEDKDVSFVFFNVANYVHLGVIDVTRQIRGRRDLIKEVQPILYDRYFHYLSWVTLVSVLLIIVVIVSAQRQKEKAVEAFYDFHDPYLKKILRSCELFLVYLRQVDANLDENLIDNFDPDDSEDSGSSLGQNQGARTNKTKRKVGRGNRDSESNNSFLRLKRRKKKGSIVPWIGWWRLMFYVLLGVHFICLERGMSMHVDLMLDSVDNCYFLNILGLVPTIGYSWHNTMLNYMINEKNKVRGVPAFKIYRRYINSFPARVQVLSNLVTNSTEHGDKFEKMLQESFYDDACKVFDQIVNKTESGVKLNCDVILDGVLRQGLMIALQTITEEILEFIAKLDYISKEKDLDKLKEYPFEGDCPEMPGKDLKSRYRMCLAMSGEFYKFGLHLDKIIRPFTQYISDQILAAMKKSIDKEEALLYNFYFIYLMTMFGVTVLIYATSISFNTSIRKINSMMRFHSLERIRENRKMRRYLSYWMSL